MWIKTRDKCLHDATGCSVRVQAEAKPGRKPGEPLPNCLALVSAEGHVRVLERDVTPERAAGVLGRLEEAIVARQVLVEV